VNGSVCGNMTETGEAEVLRGRKRRSREGGLVVVTCPVKSVCVDK
jgi:hypothetical protein